MLKSYCRTNTKCSISLYAFDKIPRSRIRSQVARFMGANMGPTWVLSAPDRPRVGLMNLAMKGIPSVHMVYVHYWLRVENIFVPTSVTRHGMERWLKPLLSAICMRHYSLTLVNWCTAAIHIICSSVCCKTYNMVLLNEGIYFSFTSIDIFWCIIQSISW